MNTKFFRTFCKLFVFLLVVLFYGEARGANKTMQLQTTSPGLRDTSQTQKTVRLKKAKKIKNEEKEQEDGVDNNIMERAKQEFLQRRDPQLNRVPVERLLVARQKRDQFMNNVKVRMNTARPQGNVVKPLGNGLTPTPPAPPASPATISGMQWQERGPNNVGGRTRALIFDIGDAANGYKRVFAGGVGGGLWVTGDITASPVQWTKINDFFDNIAISCIAQNPVNPLEIYAGTGEGFYNGDQIQGLGVWKSSDGGATWTHLASTTPFLYINAILVDRNGSVYVAGLSQVHTGFGVDQSTDGGNSWANVINSAEAGADLELAANGDVYASTGIYASHGHIYLSDFTINGAHTGNAGTWTNITPETNGVLTPGTTSWNRIKLAVAPGDANIVYAFFEGLGTTLSSVQQYNKSANTWTVKTIPTEAFGNGQAWYSIAAAVDPNNPNVLYAGSLDAEKSTDGGATWTQYTHWSYPTTASNYVHADHHAYVYAPGSSSKLLMGTDGGVFYTTNADGTPSFANKNNGYNVTQFYSVALHPTDLNYALAGAQDNGSQVFTSAGVGPTSVATGGDGADVFIDQTNGNIQITSYVYDQYYVSTNNGVSFTGLAHYGTGQFINPTDYDASTKSLYAGSASGYFFRAVNILSPSYTRVWVTSFNSANVTAVKVSPLTANRVYFGLSNGTVVRVENVQTGLFLGGVILTPIGGASATVSCVNVDPTNEDHILVTYSNYGVAHIMETKNASAATPTWTNVSGNLPDMPVRWSLFYPGDPTKVIIATELGVWTTDLINGTSTVWDPTNTGLANVEVDMLTYRATDKTIAAATHGRGVFTANLQPILATSGTLAALNTTTGTASSSESFSISGNNLTGNLTVTAPAGFDVSPDNSTWSGSAGSFTVTTTGTLAPTPVFVRLDAGDAPNSYSGNVSVSGGGATAVTAPIPASTVVPVPTTINSIVATGTYSNATSIQFTATFAASITGLSTSNFSLTTTGSVSGASVASVSGSGTTYTITVNTGTGDGSIGLNLDNASGLTPGISTSLPFTGGAIIIDKTAPTIAVSAPSVSQIGAGGSGTVSYTVTYADANFNASTLSTPDITLNSTGTAIGTVGVSGSGTSYTVTISSINGAGTLGISIGANTAGDLAGNTAPAAGPSGTFNVLSTNAGLASLGVSKGVLSPAFATGTPSYTTTVGNGITTFTVTPTTSDANATVTVNGTTLPSGTASGPIGLNVGSNLITIVVTAPDNLTQKTYTETVNRAPAINAKLGFLATNQGALTPGFVNTTTSYTQSVANYVTSIVFTPTTGDPAATVTVNGTAVTSHTNSAPQPLAVGDNVEHITVTAGDGTTQLTYTVIVTRAASSNAYLAGLQLSKGSLTPSFAPRNYSYTSTVGNGITSITLTPTTSDAGATVTVNGIAVSSGTASGPITLVVGNNNISVMVTAIDGVTKQTYSLTVTRAPSQNAKLGYLATNQGVLTPGFVNTTTSYTKSVANYITSIVFIPTAGDPTATVTVNGAQVMSHTNSLPQPLSVGDNIENITVTAGDGVTQLTYTITVNRAMSGANSVYEPVSVSKAPEKPQLASDGISVHLGLSPNGDGINDFLLIDGITKYPDNKLQIMNKSGQLVYEAKGYDNSTKVFDGHSNKNGKMQLPGTYFYSLDVTANGVTQHKTGFIVLKY